MDKSNKNFLVFLDYIQKESGSASVWFESSTVRAWGLEILSKKNKDMSEIKDRNNGTGWGDSMNTETASEYFPQTYIRPSKKGSRGEQNH